jgi:hypothetical protein
MAKASKVFHCPYNKCSLNISIPLATSFTTNITASFSFTNLPCSVVSICSLSYLFPSSYNFLTDLSPSVPGYWPRPIQFRYHFNWPHVVVIDSGPTNYMKIPLRSLSFGFPCTTFWISSTTHDALVFTRIFLNPLNAELNPICHFLVLLGSHPILHISRIGVNNFFVLEMARKHQNYNYISSFGGTIAI